MACFDSFLTETLFHKPALVHALKREGLDELPVWAGDVALIPTGLTPTLRLLGIKNEVEELADKIALTIHQCIATAYRRPWKRINKIKKQKRDLQKNTIMQITTEEKRATEEKSKRAEENALPHRAYTQLGTGKQWKQEKWDMRAANGSSCKEGIAVKVGQQYEAEKTVEVTRPRRKTSDPGRLPN